MLKIRTLLMVVALSIAAFGFTACERGREPVERTATQQQEDQRLTEQVQAALETHAAYKFPDVQVATYAGRVQLSGFVLTDDQRQAAERLARTIPGVQEVENQITLKQ